MVYENNLNYVYLMINLKIKLITLTLAIQKGHLKVTVNTVLKILVQHAAKVRKANSSKSFREPLQTRTENLLIAWHEFTLRPLSF